MIPRELDADTFDDLLLDRLRDEIGEWVRTGKPEVPRWLDRCLDVLREVYREQVLDDWDAMHEPDDRDPTDYDQGADQW